MAAAPASGMSKEQLRAWRAFLRAHSAMLRRIGSDLEEAELPPLSWYDVLAALRDAPDATLRQVEIADRILLSTSGLSRLLDRIEGAGLVRRVPCPEDRRSLNVVLTDEGREMLERMWPVYARGVVQDFLPVFGSNPQEIAQAMEEIAEGCDRDCDAQRDETRRRVAEYRRGT
jgi:DNA-binding MarR family transcriptional regulator